MKKDQINVSLCNDKETGEPYLNVKLGPLSAQTIADIVMMMIIPGGKISNRTAKDVLDFIYEKPDVNPVSYVDQHNLSQITDLPLIMRIVDEIIAANPDKVEQARAKPTLIGWFVGQVMKSSGGKANPQAVNDLLMDRLGI